MAGSSNGLRVQLTKARTSIGRQVAAPDIEMNDHKFLLCIVL